MKMWKTNDKYDPTVHHHKCQYCGAGFASKQERAQHKQTCGPPSNHNDKNPAKCARCNQLFWTNIGMVDIDGYRVTRHAYHCRFNPEKLGKIQCKECKKWFHQDGSNESDPTPDGSQLTICNFQGDSLFSCNWCKRMFKTIDEGNKHTAKCKKKAKLQFMEKLRKFGKPDMGTCQECETRITSINIL